MVLRLTDDLDVSRGDLLAAADEPSLTTRHLSGTVAVLSERPLRQRDRVLLRVGTRTVRGLVDDIVDQLDIATMEQRTAPDGLALNAIGRVRLRLADDVADRRLPRPAAHRVLPAHRRRRRVDPRRGHGRRAGPQRGRGHLMSTPSYPADPDLTGRRVVVVGGGPVAARKAAALVEAGALVDVIAPFVCEDLAAWPRRARSLGGARLPPRRPARTRARLAGAHGHRRAARRRAGLSRGRRRAIWCVRADDAAASTAWTPAVARGAAGTASEGLTVAVSAGADPRRATAVRDAVLAALDSGTLPVRRVRSARPTDAHRTNGTAEPAVGRVALVGGGPGADDLITVRGRALLAAADVVVTDRLGPRGLLRTLGSDVEVVDVGKTPATTRSARSASTSSSSTTPGSASAWSGSRAATRSSSGAVARRPCTAWPTACPSRWCPA